MSKTKFQSSGIPNWLGAALLFLLIIGVYWPVFGAGFIWDDNSMLTANQFVQARDGLGYIWFSTGPVDYFPLTYSSLWLEWRLWGMNATGYHITNLLLHGVSSVLLWRIFKLLKLPCAWLAALLFGLHPVNVESVAWIAERKNTLCLLFYVLSLLFFLHSERAWHLNDPSKRKSRLHYILSLLFFLLALFSKTSVVMFPFVLLLCLWWQNKKIISRDMARTIPFFVLSLALGLVTIWFQHHRAIADDVIREASLLTRLGDAGPALWFYLAKAFFPLRLSFVYPDWDIPARMFLSILAWVALAAGFAIGWWKRRGWGRHLLFALGYFVLMLLPVLGFLNIYFHRYALVADHWQYFALPGVIALVVGSVAHLLKTRLAIGAFGLAMGIWFAFAASQHAKIFRNSETLWRDTLAKNPNAFLALNNFGLILDRRGQSDEAIVLFQKSVRIQPMQIEGYNNLGTALLNQGKINDAMVQYRQALQINPRNALTHYNIATGLDRQNKTDEALAEYGEALRLDPNYVDAHNNLGCMLVLRGKLDEGMTHFRAALRANPDNVDSLNNLGSTLIELGKPREAIPLLQRALKLRPDYSDAFYNYGNALFLIGQPVDAINAYSAAIKLNPQMSLAYYKNGNVLFQLGKRDEALAHFLRALELNPAQPEAHYQAAVIFSMQKKTDLATQHFKEAIRLKPDWIEPLNNLAWILATHSDEEFRDGNSAVNFAQRACDLTQNKNSGILDTLAAAYAEQNDFAKAIHTATQAVELAAASGNKNAADEIRNRLELYRAGKPFRE